MISNPIHSERMMYAARKNDKWEACAWDEILSDNLKVDHDNLIKEIVSGTTYNSCSLTEDVKCIPPGACFHDDGDHTVRTAWPIQLLNDNALNDPAETLARVIQDRISIGSRQKIYVVRLTGGLDSTGIMLALLESVPANRIFAITWNFERGSCQADLIAARQLCKQYNIRHIVLELDPNMLLQKPLVKVPPTLNLRLASMAMYKYELEAIRKITSEPILFIDGHGGDHIFCEVIPPTLVKYLALTKRPIQSLKALFTLARIEGCSVKHMLISDRRKVQASQYYLARYFYPDVAENYNRPEKTLDAQRRDIISEAIIQNASSVPTGISYNVFYPFTTPAMLSIGIALNVQESFDSKRKRIQYRDSLQRRYDVSINRVDKGHITGAYQVALKTRKAEFRSLVTNGLLAKSGKLKTEQVLSDMERSTRGVGGINSVVYKIICAELLLNDRG